LRKQYSKITSFSTDSSSFMARTVLLTLVQL
jgi:hypothetical protein